MRLNKNALIVMLMFAIIATLLCTGCSGKTGESLDELLSLGQKYLEEGNYEEAIVAFEKAIKIDDKCVEAYIGLADAYVGTGDVEKAIEALEKGYEKTKDEALQEKLETISDRSNNGSEDILESSESEEPELKEIKQINDADFIAAVLASKEMDYLGQSLDEIQGAFGKGAVETDEYGNIFLDYNDSKEYGSIGFMFRKSNKTCYSCIVPVATFFPDLNENDGIKLSQDAFNVSTYDDVSYDAFVDAVGGNGGKDICILNCTKEGIVGLSERVQLSDSSFTQ